MNKTPIKSSNTPDTGKHPAKPGQEAGMSAPGATVPPKNAHGAKDKAGVITPAPHKNAGTTP